MLRNEVIDSVHTDEGLLELRRRGQKDFMILIGGRVLMAGTMTASERALAEKGCGALGDMARPRVLIGGLGLGFTLRAALDVLPKSAVVVVAELNAKVVEWCKGPVAALTGNAALDPRVHFLVGDVTAEIRRIAEDRTAPRYDAVLWDLYVGPARRCGDDDPLYGVVSMRNTCTALSANGVFGVWGEDPSPAFEARLRKSGFTSELIRTEGRGLRHAVYLAVKGVPTHPKRTERKRRG